MVYSKEKNNLRNVPAFGSLFSGVSTEHPARLNSAGEELVVQTKRRILPREQILWEQVLALPEVSWGHGLILQWEGLTFDLTTTRSWYHRLCTMHLPHLSWSSNPLLILQSQKGGKILARWGDFGFISIMTNTTFMFV